jgi:hypothetical protein
LLDFQERVARRHPLVKRTFDFLNGWIDRRLERDVAGFLQAADPEPSMDESALGVGWRA